jgi:two-component system, NtrC family, response regulator AtoC
MGAVEILVIEDEAQARSSLKEWLAHEGYGVSEATDGRSAVAALDRAMPDLVLLDIHLPDTDGLRILGSIHERAPDLPVIMIAGHASVDAAVEAMKLGAYDYVAKPFNKDALAITVRRALEAARLRRDVRAYVHEQKLRFGLHNIVGRSRSMREIVELVRKVSASQATTVLLRGESGTGKDVLARAIHGESARGDRPFMNITCTALQDTLLESELFGHEKGSFTDAKAQKKGLFELADGGTVLMDEIGDMSPALQGKVLRVLEERTFKRIGGTQDIRVDVRVIASTHRDLERLIEQKAFREDLYYRLNVITIDVPPLRARLEDVALLATHFLKHFAREFTKGIVEISESARRKLEAYDWPGNVRELRNVIERAVLLGSGPALEPDDLLLGRTPAPVEVGRPRVVLPPEGLQFDDVERELISQAIQRSAGNQTRAAELLGMTRDKLHYRLEKYGLLKPGTDA